MSTIEVYAHGRTYKFNTTREVTHAVASVSPRGDDVVMLTRSPKSAVATARRFGDTMIQVFEIVDGRAGYGS